MSSFISSVLANYNTHYDYDDIKLEKFSPCMFLYHFNDILKYLNHEQQNDLSIGNLLSNIKPFYQ